MLRGFRWQLIALILACVLFIASLTTRLSTETPDLPPETTQVSEETTPDPTLTPTSTPESPVTVVADAPTGEIVMFREGVVGKIQRINPLLADLNSVDQDIASLIFEGLFQINAYGEPEPQLAQSWVTSSDGLEYVIQLREDVLWQDGIGFSADDVMFTMGILRSANFPGPEALGRFWRTVETEQLGSHLIRFRLTQPLGSFLDKLTIGILPVHALQGITAEQIDEHPFNLTPIGTGPYQIEGIRSFDNSTIQIVDLRVAPVYRQRPEGQGDYGIDRIRFQTYGDFESALEAFRQGEIDGLAARNRNERAPLINATSGDQIHTMIEPTLGVIIFNWQNADTQFFREQRVRLALEIGLDRASIIERWMRNTAIKADSPLMIGSWAYAADLAWPPHDVVAARSLLETANIRLPETEQSEGEATEEVIATDSLLRFSILTPDEPALSSMMNEVAAQWSQLNIDVQTETVDPQSYQSRLDSGDFDAALVELSLSSSADPDVYTFWHQGQYPDGLNYGGVDDRRISEILERGRREASGINRSIYYETFQQDFVDRAIALPLYYPLYTYLTSANFAGVQLGFMGVPSDRFKTIQDWTLR